MPEDEYHDFKQEWYIPEKRDEMIKDIFSFVNTRHHKDCYLIFGVTDKEHRVIGIENDENRLNTQKLTDKINSLPIATNRIPEVKVETLIFEEHEVDVLIIKNTDMVPVYLEQNKQMKKCKKVIHAGQIFTRVNDTNTAINSTAKDYLVSDLWKKRFGLDLKIIDKYKMKLEDINNWEYFEYEENSGFMYDIEPDYCIYIERPENRDSYIKADSFSLDQFRSNLSWVKLIFKYRNVIVTELDGGFLDGSGFLSVIPETSILECNYNENLLYNYMLMDSLAFKFEKMIFSGSKEISPDDNEIQKFSDCVVVFKNNSEKELVEEGLLDEIGKIQEEIKTSDREIKSYKHKVKIGTGKEFEKNQIESLIIKKKTSQFIVKKMDKASHN
ncbi:ATP-binding protein [Lactobacillus sp. ESL0679]|nr:ATP-binding protein [Lactobacillus sp. ESL0679]